VQHQNRVVIAKTREELARELEGRHPVARALLDSRQRENEAADGRGSDTSFPGSRHVSSILTIGNADVEGIDPTGLKGNTCDADWNRTLNAMERINVEDPIARVRHPCVIA
jgi:hypothetical protein